MSPATPSSRATDDSRHAWDQGNGNGNYSALWTTRGHVREGLLRGIRPRTWIEEIASNIVQRLSFWRAAPHYEGPVRRHVQVGILKPIDTEATHSIAESYGAGERGVDEDFALENHATEDCSLIWKAYANGSSCSTRRHLLHVTFTAPWKTGKGRAVNATRILIYGNDSRPFHAVVGSINLMYRERYPRLRPHDVHQTTLPSAGKTF